MKLRSALISAMGVLAISTLSTVPASAEAGWQSLGNSDFYLDADGSGCHTETFSSGGGYIRASYYRPGHPDTATILRVYEYDPDNADDYITEWDTYDSSIPATFYVENYTDGDNGKAEIYFRGPCTGAPWVHVDD
ncbi:hypothetical protein [Streptomyces fagopyri]|uniref:hypothetical protein n=1 Tax=Streptomyces fagopyri TaxID=2662397 RepID=UPI0037F60ACD